MYEEKALACRVNRKRHIKGLCETDVALRENGMSPALVEARIIESPEEVVEPRIIDSPEEVVEN